jgi:HlyD family secretion protein
MHVHQLPHHPRTGSRWAALALLSAALTACADPDQPDAFGNFEADEVVVAAEASGRIQRLDALEGRVLALDEDVGLIDSTQLALERDQLEAQRRAIGSQRAELAQQITTLEVQREIAERTLARTQRLFASQAATAAQRDAAERELRVLQSQVAAARLGLERVAADLSGLTARAAAVADRLQRTRISNPVAGTVLAQYARAGEMIQTGQALYRVADLDSLTLRAYLSGGQLASVTLGDRVTVQVDGADGELRSHDGIVTWVSPRAEFTPTPVQTRDARADLVYAIKIRVANTDGRLKVGMPADVTFRRGISGQTP